jgi:hypothetical protein
VDHESRVLGLLPGLALADARARVPELLAFDRDPHADRQLLERIAGSCLRYTPMVLNPARTSPSIASGSNSSAETGSRLTSSAIP